MTLTWVAGDDCYNKKTELFLSENYYFPKGMNVKFSKNCEGCSLELLSGEVSNFYEVNVGKKAIGKKVTLTISAK